jgi:SpoVK/Ycf46/Vps4 family AAA+-type ATPase
MPESVLQYLLGIAVIDAELPVRRLGLPTGHLTWSGPLARTASTRKHADRWLTQRNFSAFVVDAAQISDAREFDARWTRDSLLHAAALIVEGEPATVNAVLQAAQYPHVVVGAATPERPAIDEPKIDREAVWREALGSGAKRMNGKLSHLARQFRLDEAEIHLAAASTEPWQAAREIARRDLDGLAMRIDSRATWNDLILPPATEAMLREVTAQTRHRHRVYEEWGMGSRSRRGLGIAALFHGPSGTGKTLTAEVIANELQVDLYHVDLSQIVSKYIGETEKNLEKIFTAAERAVALLLFDEADALFGKRSEIRDAHDRYANIEVGYLLQRIEAYDGLVILTTNLKGSLDSAFLRRFRFVVSFPFPDTEDRRRLWQIAFPDTAPVEEIDTHRLSRVVLSGGSIRNIALAAAFLAAEESGPINTDRVLRAASRELAKMERSSSELAEVMT